MSDRRVRSAASNNADLYEAVFRAHGLSYRRLGYAFVADDPPPPYYSDVTVQVEGYGDEVCALAASLRRSRGSGFSVKDSFSEIDLTSCGSEGVF